MILCTMGYVGFVDEIKFTKNIINFEADKA